MDLLPSELKLHIFEILSCSDLSSLLSLAQTSRSFWNIYSHAPIQEKLLRTFARAFIPPQATELCLAVSLLPTQESAFECTPVEEGCEGCTGEYVNDLEENLEKFWERLRIIRDRDEEGIDDMPEGS